jgi:hypothetical protein
MRKSMTNRTAFLTLMAAALVLLAAALPAKADTLYTTSGTPPTYNNTFPVVFFDPNNPGTTFAEAFVPTETAMLTDAILPLQSNGTSDVITVYIESSTAGAPSGTILDTLTATGPLGGTPQLITFSCTTCPQLTLGTTYFVVAQQTAGPDQSLWYAASPFVVGTPYFSSTGVAGPFSMENSDLGAFEVDGTPVATPEPSINLLLGAGLLGLLVMGRKKFVGIA